MAIFLIGHVCDASVFICVYCFLTTESEMATCVKVGTSLEKYGITEDSLLAFECSSEKNKPTLKKVPKVTNELVLGLFHFLNQHPECTFLTLTQWLSCLFCEKWPSQTPPTVKSIRQSVVRLNARYSKLKKQRTSAGKHHLLSLFLGEEYSLPRVFMFKGKLMCTQLSQSVKPTYENETLQAVNEDLCKELAELKLENDSLKDAEESVVKLRQKLHVMHRNATKKLKRRDETISQQVKSIDQQKKESVTLQRKITQLEPQLQKLKRDKDKLRHRADYWKAQVQQLKSSYEEKDVQEIVDQQQVIEELKGEVHQLEENNVELRDTVEEIMSLSLDKEISTFHKGKYTDDIHINFVGMNFCL